MANEVMARAITGIDDKLITDAYSASHKKRNLKPLYSIGAMAACLVLILTTVFALSPKGTQIYLYSEKVTDTPCIVNEVSPVSSSTRIKTQELTIPFDIKLTGETKITCSEGTMKLCGVNQDTLFYSGSSFLAEKEIAKKELSLYWTIESPEKTETYTLTLEGTKTQILTLEYDEESYNWSVFIEK